MTRLTDAFDELSSRAAPTDPGAVLAGARTEVRRRVRRRRTTLAGLGVAAALAVVVGLVARDDGGRVETDDGPVATSPTTAAPSPSTAPTTAPGPGPSTTTGGGGPSTAPTVPTSPTTAATGDGGAAGGPSGPASGARPGPATTGPTDPAALVPRTAAEIEALMRPGAVIENVAITGGNVDVVADDVTLRNFRLDAGGAPYGFRSTGGKTGFVAEDGEIVNTASAGFWGGGATFRRIEVHESGGSAFKPLGGVTIESSWWHHLGRGGGSANAVQFQGEGGASGVTLRGNLCDLPVSVAGAAGYGSSACVLVSTDAAVTATVEGNWFEGGNYTVDCDGQAGVAVRDNRFGRDLRNGPVRDCPTAAGNVWDDSGAPVP
jgi:hypothetical protein